MALGRVLATAERAQDAVVGRAFGGGDLQDVANGGLQGFAGEPGSGGSELLGFLLGEAEDRARQRPRLTAGQAQRVSSFSMTSSGSVWASEMPVASLKNRYMPSRLTRV